MLWKAFTNNFLLKIIALFLAVVTWFYVSQEIDLAHNILTARVKVLPSYGKMITKKLFVKAIFIGQAQEGYLLDVAEVSVEPEYFMMAGPKDILGDANEINTEPIDISRYRRTTIYEIGINSIAPNIDTSKLRVKVTIPIKTVEKVKEEKKAEEKKDIVDLIKLPYTSNEPQPKPNGEKVDEAGN